MFKTVFSFLISVSTRRALLWHAATISCVLARVCADDYEGRRRTTTTTPRPPVLPRPVESIYPLHVPLQSMCAACAPEHSSTDWLTGSSSLLTSSLENLSGFHPSLARQTQAQQEALIFCHFFLCLASEETGGNLKLFKGGCCLRLFKRASRSLLNQSRERKTPE